MTQTTHTHKRRTHRDTHTLSAEEGWRAREILLLSFFLVLVACKHSCHIQLPEPLCQSCCGTFGYDDVVECNNYGSSSRSLGHPDDNRNCDTTSSNKSKTDGQPPIQLSTMVTARSTGQESAMTDDPLTTDLDLIRAEINHLPVAKRNPTLCAIVCDDILPRWKAAFHRRNGTVVAGTNGGSSSGSANENGHTTPTVAAVASDGVPGPGKGRTTPWMRIRKKIAKELNEIEPALEFVLEKVRSKRIAREQQQKQSASEGEGYTKCRANVERTGTDKGDNDDTSNNNTESDESLPFVIVDICSGLGITGMLLSELIPVNDRDGVDSIHLLDRFFPNPQSLGGSGNDNNNNNNDSGYSTANNRYYISIDHLKNSARGNNTDNDNTGYAWPIPLCWRKMDLKKGRERRQLSRYVYHGRPVLMVGIHLCKALSVHAVGMYHDAPPGSCLVLKPCCLPGRRHLFVNKKPIVYTFPHYSFRPLDLYYDNTDNGNGNDNDDDGSGVESLAEVRQGRVYRLGTLSRREIAKGNDDNDDNEEEEEDGHDQDHIVHDNMGSPQRTNTVRPRPKSRRHNERFKSWVSNLAQAAESPTGKVWMEEHKIQTNHFQNQFVFCQPIGTRIDVSSEQ